MADPKIPLSDLPPGVPGAFDKVAGVDTATGAARLFDVTDMPASGQVASRLEALEAGQTAGMLGFATKADMDADLAHDAGTLALVTNDTTAENNGTYRKTGSSGSGSWVLSEDRVTGLEGRVGAVAHTLAPLYEESSSARIYGDTTTATAPSTNTSGSFYVIPDKRVPEGAVRLSRVRVWSRAVGNFEVSVWRNTSGTNWTKVEAMTLAASETTVPVWYPVDLPVREGDLIGFKPIGAGSIGNSGGVANRGFTNVTAASTTFDASGRTHSQIAARIAWEVEGALAYHEGKARLDRLMSRKRFGSVSVRNVSEGTLTGLNTLVFTEVMPDGVSEVSRIGIQASSGGIYEISNWRDDGTGVYRKIDSVVTQTSTAAHATTEFRVGVVGLPVRPGDRIGMSLAPFGAFTLSYGNASGELEYEDVGDRATSFTPGATTTAALRMWIEIEGSFPAAQPPSRFKGKNVWCFGDSFTNGSIEGVYPDLLIDHLGANVTNFGRSGAYPGAFVGIMTPADHRANGWTDKIPDLTYADADAVTIMLGQNGGVSGSIEDIPPQTIYDLPYDPGTGLVSTVKQHLERFPDTYYGNMGIILEYLRWIKPDMEVFLISPTVSSGYPLPDYFATPMIQLAEKFGARYIDVRRESGVTMRNNSVMTYDTSHPSWEGQKLIARYVAAKMVG